MNLVWMILYAAFPPLLLVGSQGYLGQSAYETAEDWMSINPAPIIVTTVLYVVVAIIWLVSRGQR